MSLSSLQLDAFLAVAQAQSFSEAAKRLHITQSALSQRVLNLEEEVEVSLFLRESSGVLLTETGGKLLKYCQIKSALEDEFLGEIRSTNRKELSGIIRVAGFSTFNRSVLMPKVGKFARAHPQAQIELLTREIRELPHLLRSGQADLIFTTQPFEKPGFERRVVGHEENVLIESRQHASKENVFIDHDEHDTTTADFWRIQRTATKKYSRVYFDEIYSIIDAVSEGLGRAVVPKHMVNDSVRVVSGLKALEVEIYLMRFEQAYYTRLQEKLVEALTRN